MRSIFVFTLTAVALAVACGGKFDTSVSSSEPTNQLPPADSNQLCNDEYNYITSSFSVDDLARISCGGSYEQGGDCTTEFNLCVAQRQGVTKWPPPDCTAFANGMAQCDVTVGEYTDCIQQQVNVMKSIEGQLPFCSEGEAEQAYLQAESQVSAQCLQIMKDCPVTFGGSDSSSSGTPDAGPPDGG